MPIVHVTPTHDTRRHVTKPGGCWCEPDVQNLGKDAEGGPARVMVHRDQYDRQEGPGAKI